MKSNGKFFVALLAVSLVSVGFAADRNVVLRSDVVDESVKRDEPHRVVPPSRTQGTFAAAPYVESDMGCGTYSTIAGAPGAAVLGVVSTCDDCVETVTPSFVFSWFGDTPITDFNVGSNGQINIDSTDVSSNCCTADPVAPGFYPDPRIAVAQEDLDPADSAGAIWALDTGTSIIIDYADIGFFEPGSITGSVNAQAELFANGCIDIRWGTVVGDAFDDIAAGVEEASLPSHTPATGVPFGAGGIVSPAGGLDGMCRRFTPTGVDCDVFGPVPECVDGAGGACNVFVTSTSNDGNLGGVVGADAQCNALAGLAGLGGTYKAWISDSASSPPATFVDPTTQWELCTGALVATDLADLTDGTIATNIKWDENCDEIGANRPRLGSRAWTGTRADGTAVDGGALCSDWTSNSFFDRGAQGRLNEVGASWTYAGASPCSSLRRLYCFEQQIVPPVVPPPSPKFVFASSSQSSGNLGGVAGADATCNALAAAALPALPGTYKAWLSDSAGDPNSTFATNAAGYFKPSGAIVAVSYADLTDGTLISAINQDENGNVLAGPAGSRAWTGTDAFGSGLDGAKCTDWTSGGADRGAQGQVPSASSTWSFSGAAPCSQQRRIYCIEQ